VGRSALIRVLIADDHALVRAGIVALLHGLGDVDVVGEAGDGAGAVAMAARLMPDVVVLDISMKGLDGLQAAAQIVKICPGAKVIMLSMHTDRAFVQQALAAGASAYLVKDAATAELDLALRCVVQGKTYLSEALSRSVVEGFMRQGVARNSDPALTPRQTEVLKLLAEGKSTKEIAFGLGLSAKTVESHRAQIQERLGIRDLAGLIRYAMRTGLTPPEA
jgi:DNA-binding NarL/FixJ family response regulator